MSDFYLITGFLGAGKTTFLKNFIKQFASKKVYLIINEFGKEGVDGALLKEIGAVLEEVTNGSVFCSCRLDKFEAVLNDAVLQKPDVIITEASGLSDPTNVKKVLGGFKDINYKGSICLADALRLNKVFETATVVRRQLAVSSLVVINKTDQATKEQIEQTKKIISEVNPTAHTTLTQFGSFQKEWFSFVSSDIDVELLSAAKDITLQTITLNVSPDMDKRSFESLLNMLCDNTYRIKGLLTLNGEKVIADCVGPDVKVSCWQGETNNKVVLLAGKGMALRQAVKKAKEWYPGFIEIFA